jgi:hypothetical protein
MFLHFAALPEQVARRLQREQAWGRTANATPLNATKTTIAINSAHEKPDVSATAIAPTSGINGRII